ncbi:hypothetical protein SISSUDRAFT_1053326 [Sistotremastrum suecicum HHB10207 ss-3]|uniref:Uncharacterized protein n=1 Tax=Sistotremastrum suecicum HHB10207 ss-3 TaxID=1314776 RepID=A0A165Z9P0_9AGAM|nr:hypothetical protein SISSUDRAFT_1053326 [Sistotremastrum suecicum HHB10207 ss-3]
MIETYIVARKRDKKFPAYLIDDDLHTLLLQIYKLWTSVTSLHVVGNATAILRALCNPHDILLPNLHTITFVQLYGDTTTTCDGKGRAKILDHRYVEFEEQQFPEGLVMDTEQL